MSKNISVPDIGDFKDVEIIEVLVKPGDQIKKNDPIVTLESDESSVEVPSPYDGKISQLKVKISSKMDEERYNTPPLPIAATPFRKLSSIQISSVNSGGSKASFTSFANFFSLIPRLLNCSCCHAVGAFKKGLSACLSELPTWARSGTLLNKA